jgi:hypothetical protein
MEYSQGKEAIYKNQVVRVIANYTDKKEAKIIWQGESKNVPYSELVQIITKDIKNEN